MRFRQLDHVALHVADVERSCRFYADVLRLEPIPRPTFTFPGAWFRLGERQELHLIGERTAPVQSHNRGNHFALLTDDLDAWEEHLRRLGATYHPPRLRPTVRGRSSWSIPTGTTSSCARPRRSHLAPRDELVAEFARIRGSDADHARSLATSAT